MILPAPSVAGSPSWIGNSQNGNPFSVQEDVEAMFVKPDGTIITNSHWDEAGRESGLYKAGVILGSNADLHGWGRSGGSAVTADSTYSYVAISQNGCNGGSAVANQYGGMQYPTCGNVWYAVRRYNSDGTSAPFTNGNGWDGSFLIVNTNLGDLSGLAIGNGNLYVSSPAENLIKIYKTTDMSFVSSFAVTNPGALAFDTSNTLWVAQKGAGKILRYSSAGTLMSQAIAVANATALTVDSSGRLLVADNGLDQNVKYYSSINTTPVLSGTFGQQGGTYAAGGVIGAQRFHGLTGLGTDTLGNLYVSMNGWGSAEPSILCADVRVFTAGGSLTTRFNSNEFVSTAVFDPSTDGADIYSNSFHYQVDYAKSTPGTQATDYGFTLNFLKYPDDPRIQLGGYGAIAVRTIQGHKFSYHLNQGGNGLVIYRYSGETAIPSAWFGSGGIQQNRAGQNYPATAPSSGAWNWVDLNGDGEFQANEFSAGLSNMGSWAYSVDIDGNIWMTSSSQKIRKFPVGTLDGVGNLVYDSSKMVEYSLPGAGYTNIRRVFYQKSSDALFVGGYINGASDDGCWSVAGKTLTRYDKLSTGNMVQTWQISMPYTCSTQATPTGMDVAGNAIFTVDVSNASVSGGSNPLVRVYDALTGNQTVNFSWPSNLYGYSGWTDTPYALTAYSRANGQYEILVEDDARGRILMYTWPGQ